jgi:hypothetical protein
MAIFTGDMIGISGNGNWQAMGIGSYEVTKTLAFSSVLSGNIYKTAKGTLNINSYAMPGVNSNMGIFQGVDYETVYFRADSDTSGSLVKYGWQRESSVRNYYTGQRVSYAYYPNNSYQRFEIINGVPVEGLGTTSRMAVWPDFHTSPPTSPIITSQGFVIVNDVYPFEGSLTVNPTNKEFAKIYSQKVEDFYTTVRLNPDSADPAFKGILGGYTKDGDPDRTLWNATAEHPMGLSLMGEHISFEAPVTMSAGIESSYNNTSKTPDGGAYFGFLTNSVAADRNTRGMFYGLYISPSGEAGFLQSTNILGASYAGLNMWEADGDLYSVKLLDSISVSPSDLLAKDAGGNYINLQYGALSGSIEYGGASGDFVSGGSIKRLALEQGSTMSIKGYPCNGIFSQGGSGGTYNNRPDGVTTWQADFAGYGTFGYPGNFADYGIWRMNVDDVSSSWADNKIYALLTGEFLTYTKQGTLNGTFLGNYSGTTSGIWGGTASGIYEKTRNVDFSSGMTGNVFSGKLFKWISGSVNVDADHYSWYSISGDPANFPEEKMYVEKTSNTAGTYTTTQYTDWGYKDDTHPITYTKTTWRYKITNGLITDQTLLETVPISYEDYLAEVVTMRSGVTEYTGLFMNDNRLQGVFAGFNNLSDNNNLWYNIANKQSTEIALAGLYDTWDDKTPSIMTAGVASFNPAVSMNPLTNSTSPIGGAYFAYLGAAFGTKNAAHDTLDGMVSGLYLNPDGSAGILDGTFTSSNLPDIGYFKGSGDVKGYQVLASTTTVTSNTFVSLLTSTTTSNQYTWDEANYIPSDAYFGGVTTSKMAYLQSESKILSPAYYDATNTNWVGGPFGIYSFVAGGTYVSGSTFKNDRTYDIYNNQGTRQTHYVSTDWDNPSTTPNPVAPNVQNGSVLHNGSFDPATATGQIQVSVSPGGGTTILGADIKGLFDPTAATWQVIGNGKMIETAAFVNLVNSFTTDAEKNAFMAAMKIPCISAGSMDLAYTGGATGIKNVTMAGVNFYAYATGQTPRIFATNNVTGSYDVSTLGTNVAPAAVSLTATNMTNFTSAAATFTPTTWNTSTNAWGAQVTGSAAMTTPATGILFKGGAAGNLGGSGVTSGTFSGTAAGIVR